RRVLLVFVGASLLAINCPLLHRERLDLAYSQVRSSGGTVPPCSASLCMTVRCSQVFICAESAILSCGQPSSVASSLRDSRLLSRPSSLSRSTMDVRQFNCSG